MRLAEGERTIGVLASLLQCATLKADRLVIAAQRPFRPNFDFAIGLQKRSRAPVTDGTSGSRAVFRSQFRKTWPTRTQLRPALVLTLTTALVSTLLLASGSSLAQSPPAPPGPTGAPKTSPPINLPSSTPKIADPVVLEPPATTLPILPQISRDISQDQLTRRLGPRLQGAASRCQLTSARDWPGVVRTFASVQATISGNLREEINSRLTITGACFGERSPGVFGGLMVRLVRADGTEERFFRPLPYFGNEDLMVQSWSTSKIELTVPQLINPAILPLAPSDTLRFDLITSYGRYRATLTQTDIDRLDRDGVLTFPPPP